MQIAVFVGFLAAKEDVSGCGSGHFLFCGRWHVAPHIVLYRHTLSVRHLRSVAAIADGCIYAELLWRFLRGGRVRLCRDGLFLGVLVLKRFLVGAWDL